MRPARFLQLLVSAARTAPGVTRVEPVTDDGCSARPYLLAVEAGGRTTRWQVTATSAPGDDYAKPERAPVIGEKPALLPAGPATGDVASVEAALIAAVLQADGGEIASVERYSTREQPPAVGWGATFVCHDGSKLYLSHVR